MFSWAQEEIWNIFSIVPRPPSKAMKASAWSNIAFIRSDIVETVVSFQLFFWWYPLWLKLLEWYPKLDCLLKIQLLTHSPINPRLLSPYTKWIFLLVYTWPRWFANSKNSSFPWLDPLKTQIFFIWWSEEPAISTHFYICWMYGLSRNEMKEEKIL